MGSTTTVRYDFTPEMDHPILIEGLPGVGNVGKIAADYLCEKLDGKKFATIYSESFPPQVILDNDCVVHMACNELWYAKVNGKDVVFLRGNYQGSTPEGQYLICDDLMRDVFLRMDLSYIYTLGGYGTGQMVDKPRVLGAVSDIALKQELHGEFPAHAFEMIHGHQRGMFFFFGRRILIVIYIKLLVHDQKTNQPFREKFLSRLAISTAVRAASAPRLPALVPLRSIACSMFSVETTP